MAERAATEPMAVGTGEVPMVARMEAAGRAGVEMAEVVRAVARVVAGTEAETAVAASVVARAAVARAARSAALLEALQEAHPCTDSHQECLRMRSCQ